MFLLLILSLSGPALACIKTIPSEGTTLPPTTTAAPGGCQSCKLDSINLGTTDTPPAGQEPGTTTPMLAPVITVNGCSQTTATCALPAGATGQSLMEFQNGIGTPYQGQTINAPLVCNAKGMWEFTEVAVTTVVTEVNCFYTG